MSFLRKQESWFIPAQGGTQAIGRSLMFWIPTFAGMTLLSRLRLGPLNFLATGRGQLFHSAKVFRKWKSNSDLLGEPNSPLGGKTYPAVNPDVGD